MKCVLAEVIRVIFSVASVAGTVAKLKKCNRAVGLRALLCSNLLES